MIMMYKRAWAAWWCREQGHCTVLFWSWPLTSLWGEPSKKIICGSWGAAHKKTFVWFQTTVALRVLRRRRGEEGKITSQESRARISISGRETQIKFNWIILYCLMGDVRAACRTICWQRSCDWVSPAVQTEEAVYWLMNYTANSQTPGKSLQTFTHSRRHHRQKDSVCSWFTVWVGFLTQDVGKLIQKFYLTNLNLISRIKWVKVLLLQISALQEQALFVAWQLLMQWLKQ